MPKKSDIPKIQPFQFDKYMFSSPKRHTNSLFESFHIEPIEEYKKHINLPILPHRRSVYFFLFVTQGVAVRSKSLNQYEIKANHFFCLPAFQITSIKSFSKILEFATIIGFLTAPIIAFLNIRAITNDTITVAYRPSKAMISLAYLGLVASLLFAFYYLATLV